MPNSHASFHSLIYPQDKIVPQSHCSVSYWESVVELVGEQRVGQLSEVQLAEGAHRVDILSEDVSGQIWDLFWVKLVPIQQIEEEDINQCRSETSAHLSIWEHKHKEDFLTL